MADDSLWYKGHLGPGPKVPTNEKHLGPGPRVNPDTRTGSLRSNILPSTGRGRADILPGTPGSLLPDRKIYDPTLPGRAPGSDPLYDLIRQIKDNSDIEISLKTIALSAVSRVIAVTATPIVVVKPQFGAGLKVRGYIFINPAEVTSQTGTITLFPSASRAAGTFFSPSFNVGAIDHVAFFMDVTVSTIGGMQAFLQSQDPLTSKWATAVASLFGGAGAGTTQNVSAVGIDQNMRVGVSLTGPGAMTFSMSGVLKGQQPIIGGSTVYLGGPDVNSTFGYPLLAGQKEPWYLKDTVGIYAVTGGAPLQLKVFHLQ